MEVYKEYTKVKDFSELLQTNIDFFKGKLKEPYYHWYPWKSTEDQDNHCEILTKNLINLHQIYRIFTTDFQTSFSDKNIDQRSYLVCYMEKKTFNSIYKNLLDDTRIYTIFIVKQYQSSINYSNYSNYSEITSLSPKQKRVVLTLDRKEPYSVWTRGIEARKEYETTTLDNINNILKDTVYCMIICKEWNKNPTAESILIENIENIENIKNV